ncbi:HipA domain-containing protein [Adlercreutzia sp. ZJ242]|uniref:HipA domain-containing protein n=1 Tax=Adlercreutzia sp. ZJ242 TaxID=2709409 RepID=UPI0013EE27B9|nr:HipA domain-containing protein [Adlercreutzia sp. ZJ242]
MELIVYRDCPEGPVPLGRLVRENGVTSFLYDVNYLSRGDAAAVSLSLPLRPEPFTEEELLPYFKGLLPEGEALENLCRSMGVLTTDYFTMLGSCGLDCLGDVIINPDAYQGKRAYEALTLQDLMSMAGKPGKIDASVELARLSLAGTQSKCGLFHDPAAPLDEGWYQPVGGAPSNYIVKFAREDVRDLMTVEHLSSACARACGVLAAKTSLINPSQPIICVERYDRLLSAGEFVDGMDAPLRRHQEDIAQAFAIMPAAKYRQLKPSTAAALAAFLRQNSARPAQDIANLVRLVLFNYLIGNCDNHLKNTSILYAPNWQSFQLAPAYDLVSTTYFARFSSTMGMAIGNHMEITEVEPADFRLLAEQMGVNVRLMRAAVKVFQERAIAALGAEGDALGSRGFATAPFIADDLQEEVYPRLEVLSKI